MNSIATIGYTSNLYARDQKTINYFEFQAMLADQVSDRLHWYATIHPRDEEDAYIDASERLSLCVRSQLNNQSRVLIVGGDLSGLSHVHDWLDHINCVGVEGIEVTHLKAWVAQSAFADKCHAIQWTQGFLDSPIGILWPGPKAFESMAALPKNMQVLYVPELFSSKDMLALIDLLRDW